MEKWKIIEGYEGLYEVSSLGRIRNNKGKILKPIKSSTVNYYTVNLYKNGKSKSFLIHRLVARAFVPNPNNLPQVNHKDENKFNNEASNLEWCTCTYNLMYNGRSKRVGRTKSKKLLQLSLDGQIIKEWPSKKEAVRNGYNEGSIYRCICGKLRTHKGFKWKYK